VGNKVCFPEREGGREGGRERKNMGKKEVCFPERERKRESTPTKKRKGARMRRQSKREIVCFLRYKKTYSFKKILKNKFGHSGARTLDSCSQAKLLNRYAKW
jgi:hypothetical protein